MRFPTPSFVLLVFLGVILPGGHAQSQTVVGRLLDGEAMQPIPWGFIQLLDSASQPVSFTYSDEDGDFILSAPGAGRYLILAEAYSYHAVQDGPVELRAADTIGVQFFIPPDPEQLDPLVVEAKRLDLRLRTSGFYRRQRRGMGEFITREDIDDIRPHDMSALLVWGTRGMILRSAGGSNTVPLFSRFRCLPMYFLDGIPIMDAGSEINYLIHPNSVEAVEVYVSRGETPAQYRDARARCGTILIWTRWEELP